MGLDGSGGAGLRRLAKLYGMVENLHAMQVRAAAAAVDEVERGAARMEADRREDVRRGRAGLALGSRVETIAEERTAEGTTARRVQMERMRVERRQVHAAAVQAHRQSRTELRQMDEVVKRAETKTRVEFERRAQATSDDRFLSRREWMLAKGIREQG